MAMNATATEDTLSLSEEERVELLALVERELADLRVECRRTDTPSFHDRLRDEETIFRLIAAKLRQLRSPPA
jgi:hypothetical protein